MDDQDLYWTSIDLIDDNIIRQIPDFLSIVNLNRINTNKFNKVLNAPMMLQYLVTKFNIPDIDFSRSVTFNDLVTSYYRKLNAPGCLIYNFAYDCAIRAAQYGNIELFKLSLLKINALEMQIRNEFKWTHTYKHLFNKYLSYKDIYHQAWWSAIKYRQFEFIKYIQPLLMILMSPITPLQYIPTHIYALESLVEAEAKPVDINYLKFILEGELDISILSTNMFRFTNAYIKILTNSIVLNNQEVINYLINFNTIFEINKINTIEKSTYILEARLKAALRMGDLIEADKIIEDNPLIKSAISLSDAVFGGKNAMDWAIEKTNHHINSWALALVKGIKYNASADILLYLLKIHKYRHLDLRWIMIEAIEVGNNEVITTLIDNFSAEEFYEFAEVAAIYGQSLLLDLFMSYFSLTSEKLKHLLLRTVAGEDKNRSNLNIIANLISLLGDEFFENSNRFEFLKQALSNQQAFSFLLNYSNVNYQGNIIIEFRNFLNLIDSRENINLEVLLLISNKLKELIMKINYRPNIIQDLLKLVPQMRNYWLSLYPENVLIIYDLIRFSGLNI
jgi:hypothetical protein